MSHRRLYETDAFDYEQKVPSYWESSVEAPSVTGSAFNSETIYDVAVIGGGFTGQSAALTLAKEGNLKVAIVEAGGVGWGASGRNGGFCCMGGGKVTYDKLIKKYGLSDTQHYLRIQREAVELVRSIGQANAIDFDACGEGEMMLAHKPGIAKSFKDEQYFLKSQFGIEAQLFSQSELKEQGMNAKGIHAGLHTPVGFGINPLKYTYGLYEACVRAGVHWHEHCAVDQWSKSGDLHLLDTAKGLLRARKIIVATNGYTAENLHTELSGKLLPVMSNIIVTRPLKESELEAQGWNNHTMSFDSRNLLHYFRLLPDGRFLFGGRGGISAANNSLVPMEQQLTREFQQMFPEWRDVERDYFWRGFAALSYQLSPHVSAFKHDKSAFYAMAYHGNGVAMGTWCGQQVANLLLGKKHDIPSFLQKPLQKFPLPFLRKLYLRGAYLGYHIKDACF